MGGTIRAEYERRLAAANGEYARLQARGRRFQWALLGASALALKFLVDSGHRAGEAWLFFASALIALASIFVVLRARGQGTREWRLSVYYERCLERFVAAVPESGFSGDAFRVEGHLYQDDLNVLGKHSLFDALATTRTAIGQRGLARLLLEPVEVEEARERQSAVRELSGMIDLRERVALLGRFKFEDVPAESFEQWLDGERSDFAKWDRWVVLASTLGWMGVGLCGLMLGIDGQVLLRNVVLMLVVQGMLCWRLRPRVVVELEAANKLLGQTAILREGVKVMRSQSFSAAKLVALQRAGDGEDRALKRLERQLTVVEQRPKEWFFAFSLAFCFGTHAAISLDRWKREYGVAMRRWLAAWAEFEALLALSTYAAEHEENVYAEIVDAGGSVATFEAEAMRHPLLPRDAVANDVSLGAERQFLLISGSNMAGKSTLMRAIGANAVLALAGAPVPAKSLRLGAVKIGASIAVNDSLAEGKSKFLAEVERLRALVLLARSHQGEMLFLIDEILSGTNSIDRRAAAESVLRSLVVEGAVGAISTHDLTLAEIAEVEEMHGENVHMASPDDEDPLGFDYLVKAGMNRSTNAMAIVRMLGLG